MLNHITLRLSGVIQMFLWLTWMIHYLRDYRYLVDDVEKVKI